MQPIKANKSPSPLKHKRMVRALNDTLFFYDKYDTNKLVCVNHQQDKYYPYNPIQSSKTQ